MRSRLSLLAAAALCGALAQSGGSDLRFEAASVKHSDPNHIMPVWQGGPGTSSPGQFVARSTTLVGLAMQAYSLKYLHQIDFKSRWMSTEFYDIMAKVPAGATREQFRTMLQQLLAERFGLVVQRETRQLPGYRLVVAEGGSKLKPAGIAEAASAGQPDVVVKHGTPRFSDTAGSGLLLTLSGAILRGRHQDMKGLTDQLVGRLQAPVLDATGLDGQYDYDLSFAPEPHDLPKGSVVFAPPGVVAAPVDRADAATPNDRPTLSVAIREQLGLKLETVKAIPTEVLVLDSANRDPIGN